jgi:hypothetical protein
LAASALSGQERVDAAEALWFQIKTEFPVEWDWALQDGARWFPRWLEGLASRDENSPLGKVLEELKEGGTSLREEYQGLAAAHPPLENRQWLELYIKACEQRRHQRLKTVRAKAPQIIFTKHPTIMPSFFAYTEGQSDAQNERHFRPGSELCLLQVEGRYGKVRTLVADPAGAIRDPAVSWDARKVVFAWKKSLDDDDYHLYELDLASSQVRQLTSGLGFADYEPAFLPGGGLIFSSTRCVQTVDCWWTEVSNLYTCDADGRFLRRLTVDQVHSIYPQVMDDGRVIYTRWDYNDRGQIFPQPLFQMHPDGTGQTEFYGNNSWFPTTIAHARGIPGSQKVLAILCGHHSSQAGKLAIIDPARGRQENQGVQLVAPYRYTPAERVDSYGQDGELWQYPYPIDAEECLVTYAPLGWDKAEARRGDADFGIYWMSFDGRRELLAWDARLPCSQPVPLAPRSQPANRMSRVDYTQPAGAFYVQDVYAGTGLAGVPRGTIKRLRVVALQFRAAGVGSNASEGPGGAALVSTPVSIGNGSWDVKVVLGEAKVHADGSALFTVPARVPVYFQALDDRGYAIQTMRSWSTLQPGEHAGCVGCHESRNSAPPAVGYGFTQAMKSGAQPLEPFYGPPRGFSFPREIQPILDRHCVRCHRDRTVLQDQARASRPGGFLGAKRSPKAQGQGQTDELAFSLLGQTSEDRPAKRKWSDAYLILTGATPQPGEFEGHAYRGDCQGRVVNWISSQSVPEPLPPLSAGAARSDLMKLLAAGHKNVKLSREELEKVACWIDLLVPYCGDYLEANTWTEEDSGKYERYANKRARMEQLEQENIRRLLAEQERLPGGSVP